MSSSENEVSDASSESDAREIDTSSESEGVNDNLEEIAPYLFEPVYDDDDDIPQNVLDQLVDAENNAELDREQRLHGTEWCSCGNCINSAVFEENACCCEKEEMVSVMHEYNSDFGGNIKCITEHPGFQSQCLDIWVLRSSYSHYKQQYRQAVPGQVHDKYRYVAYRQLVRWCWGILGKDIRVPLPSCALHKVRSTFESAQYIGFKYPTLR